MSFDQKTKTTFVRQLMSDFTADMRHIIEMRVWRAVFEILVVPQSSRGELVLQDQNNCPEVLPLWLTDFP